VKNLLYRLERLESMISLMESHGVLDYFGMGIDELKVLAAFIRAQVGKSE
jgi:hypothetical protein